MASRESIVNDALGHLGEERTETLADEVIRPVVRKVLGFLDKARDVVLAKHPWMDALSYLTLQPAAAGGNWRFSDVYWTPPTSLRVVDAKVSAGAPFAGAPLHWQRGTIEENVGGSLVERRVVLANAAGAALDVALVRRLGWDVIPVHLDVPLGLQLAALACFGVNSDTTKQRDLQAAADAAVIAAMGLDGVQGGGGPVLVVDALGELRRSTY